jgi:hypothetical protein
LKAVLPYSLSLEEWPPIEIISVYPMYYLNRAGGAPGHLPEYVRWAFEPVIFLRATLKRQGVPFAMKQMNDYRQVLS